MPAAPMWAHPKWPRPLREVTQIKQVNPALAGGFFRLKDVKAIRENPFQCFAIDLHGF